MLVRLAQLNPTVGDIQGNTSRILKEIESAREQGIELLILPELAICGYPPMDFHSWILLGWPLGAAIGMPLGCHLGAIHEA